MTADSYIEQALRSTKAKAMKYQWSYKDFEKHIKKIGLSWFYMDYDYGNNKYAVQDRETKETWAVDIKWEWDEEETFKFEELFLTQNELAVSRLKNFIEIGRSITEMSFKPL